MTAWIFKCTNPDVIMRHKAEVEATNGSSPMSAPHLDTRMRSGTRFLSFGSCAGFSTKFLKNHSYLDLPLFIEMHDVWHMLSAGRKNINLTIYLIEKVLQSPVDRFEFLQSFLP
jgi:malate dehydrogenase (quinone)